MASRSARASSVECVRHAVQAQLGDQRAQLVTHHRPPGGQREKVAGDLFEDEVLQAAEVEQAVQQGLFDGGDERTGRIGALHLDQPAKGSPVAALAALPESGGVTVEARVVAAQQRFLGRRAAACRTGMV